MISFASNGKLVYFKNDICKYVLILFYLLGISVERLQHDNLHIYAGDKCHRAPPTTKNQHVTSSSHVHKVAT